MEGGKEIEGEISAAKVEKGGSLSTACGGHYMYIYM